MTDNAKIIYDYIVANWDTVGDAATYPAATIRYYNVNEFNLFDNNVLIEVFQENILCDSIASNTSAKRDDYVHVFLTYRNPQMTADIFKEHHEELNRLRDNLAALLRVGQYNITNIVHFPKEVVHKVDIWIKFTEYV